MNTSCNLQIPYPPVEVEDRNRRYAEILMPLYAGAFSELTAIITYGYQTVITEKADKRMADIIECISIVEMKHFHMLAELINMLGVDPKLYTPANRGRAQWWDGRYASYEKEPQKFLENNISAEKKAISDYTEAAKRIGDKYIKAVLERIILDEEHHIKIFESLMK